MGSYERLEKFAERIECFGKYIRKKKLSSKYVATVLAVQSIYMLQFSDPRSITLGMLILVVFLIVIEYFEFLNELKILHKRVENRRRSKDRLRKGEVFAGRNGVEIPVDKNTAPRVSPDHYYNFPHREVYKAKNKKDKGVDMPEPSSDETREEWMARCIPYLINEGREQDQAVAICSSMWEQAKNEKATFEGVIFKKKE